MVNLTKRSFLFGMIATPAIVTINNIMPVKLITDVAAAIPGDGFVLVSRGHGDFFWMSQDMLNLYKYKDDLSVVRSTTLPLNELSGTARTVEQVKQLTSLEKAQVVFGPLPAFMQAPTVKDMAYEKRDNMVGTRMTATPGLDYSKFYPERSVQLTPYDPDKWL